ncbi:MAG: hypothetical protein Fur0046_23860 [Cyanobacteria bacterium J069]|nr:MAG: hypothetical protein D6742_06030 [Cyanobacteria bacterium J069]
MSYSPDFHPADLDAPRSLAASPEDTALIELSEQELEQVAGGIDLSLTFVRLDGSDELSLVSSASDYAALTEASTSSRVRFSMFQIDLNGFDSTNSLMKALSSLGKLFGY